MGQPKMKFPREHIGKLDWKKLEYDIRLRTDPATLMERQKLSSAVKTSLNLRTAGYVILMQPVKLDCSSHIVNECLPALRATENVVPGREKTYLAKILQDNHEKSKSCQILAEKTNL